jgi:hypothetical protein
MNVENYDKTVSRALSLPDQWEYQMISAANATELLNQANTQGNAGLGACRCRG